METKSNSLSWWWILIAVAVATLVFFNAFFYYNLSHTLARGLGMIAYFIVISMACAVPAIARHRARVRLPRAYVVTLPERIIHD